MKVVIVVRTTVFILHNHFCLKMPRLCIIGWQEVEIQAKRKRAWPLQRELQCERTQGTLGGLASRRVHGWMDAALHIKHPGVGITGWNITPKTPRDGGSQPHLVVR